METVNLTITVSYLLLSEWIFPTKKLNSNWWLKLVTSDSKSPQYSRTLLSIVPVFNNIVVQMIPTCPLSVLLAIFFSFPLQDCSQCSINNWQLHVPQLPPLSGKIAIIFFFFFTVDFQLKKIHYLSCFLNYY